MICGRLWIARVVGECSEQEISPAGLAPAWSADGRLAFEQQGQIAGGSAPVHGTNPAWTPDGRIVFNGIWRDAQGQRLQIVENGVPRFLKVPSGSGVAYNDSLPTVRPY